MKKQIFFISLLTIVILGSWSCKKNTAAGCSAAWAAELSDEIMAMSNAAQAYSTNPTTENCLAYKAALQSYVNALEPYGNCSTLTGADKEEWQNSIDEARQDINEMDCS